MTKSPPTAAGSTSCAKSEEYDLAYTEADPLVSFVLPTHKRYEALRDVALPSILAQTHANVEVVVVGDQAPAEDRGGDRFAGRPPRFATTNRTIRGPYPEDPSVRWYMIGSPPVQRRSPRWSAGRWIAAMADDDAVRPEFAEVLLAAAREGRFEKLLRATTG